jgi:DNA-directed RNA polymerase subunit RPC12/RpoP
MFEQLRYKFIRFMQGRYGTDQFNRFLAGLVLVLLVVNLFLHSSLLWWICMILLIYMYFRMFSRNISKRYNENCKYLELTAKIRNGNFGRTMRNFGRTVSARIHNLVYKITHWSQERSRNAGFHIYKCPQCSQKIRIPKGKGKIIVRCPKCGKEFQKRS